MSDKDKLEFWNSRAHLGFAAGSNDVIAKKLEINALKKHFKSGMQVLEIGCGNGVTSLEFAREFDLDILAVDFSEKMIENAKSNLEEAKEHIKGRIDFQVMDIKTITNLGKKFDLIFTERVLINLKDWKEQEQALTDISALLKPEGIYCMCENSLDGLRKVNEFRSSLELATITPPWHNCYFEEKNIQEYAEKRILNLESVDSFTSTYHFLSRVINAWQAKVNNEDPSYDAPINELALTLPSLGDFGQTKLWLWRKP